MNPFPSYTYEVINNGAPGNMALVVQSTPTQNEGGKKLVRVQVVLVATQFPTLLWIPLMHLELMLWV